MKCILHALLLLIGAGVLGIGCTGSTPKSADDKAKQKTDAPKDPDKREPMPK
jgi:hypothetical protein